MSQLTKVFCQCGKLLYELDEKSPYHIKCTCRCGLTSYRRGYGDYKFEEIFVQGSFLEDTECKK